MPWSRACIKHQREIHRPCCCSAYTVTTGTCDPPTQREIMNCFMPSSLLVFLLFAVLLSLPLQFFFTLVYLIFVAAYLIAFTPHTVHNFEFKVLHMRTYEENGVAHETVVIEWAVSSAS